MKSCIPVLMILLLPAQLYAAKKTTVSIIANEPVNMMDLGLLKLNPC